MDAREKCTRVISSVYDDQHRSPLLNQRTVRAHPIGIIARSNGPNFSPISLNAGHVGTLSGSSPFLTVLYPVSPAKYAFFPPGQVRSSRAHEAQRVVHRSKSVRFAVCCAGVQVSLNCTSVTVGVEDNVEDVETEIVTVRSSHQSRV